MTISQIQGLNYYQPAQLKGQNDVKNAQEHFINGVLNGKTEQEALLDTLNALDNKNTNTETNNYSYTKQCFKIDPQKVKTGLQILASALKIGHESIDIYNDLNNEQATE